MNLTESVCVTIIAFVMVYIIAKKLRGNPSKSPVKSDKVVLHQFPRSHVFWPGVLSGSPPCLKLETFLRMVKIPYENDLRIVYSKKGKMPWIEFNGQEIADSNFCVQFISKEFQVDVDSHLSATERGIAHSILTMLEENTYWTMVYARYMDDYGAEFRKKLFGMFFFPLNYWVRFNLLRTTKNYLWSHGIGRHTSQEIYEIAERDLLAVSQLLGQKNFLFGDKPCLADAALFGFMVGCTWTLPDSPITKVVKTKAQNLDQHTQRMKELLYPDWEELLLEKEKTD